ncbi:hypothetical protein GCM10010112_83030 [Actinoplanes lobatus]|uniref:Replication-relaxation n=1 Tax=Actinoplanes lobatus TaxID=113568 RepID=A0A7W7MJF2_9ACTN|nr:replication-relaxation family protein [Actinoplanes lobatus]MBB4752509.1 hypothetical protein [Actinoplanes lobatus]GGN94072.1 hypothetical protein GCM10010112_83030 [Actinoplanes lobatus]GIE44809.1 hypothetical protein Alo02nite_77070 [Actinoplanes lobatus]
MTPNVSQLLAFYTHLTPRDRAILTLLDEHRVLTADQIMRLHFTSYRTAQRRLLQLSQLRLLDRFRYARPTGGADPWLWVLGLYGARYMAGTLGRPMPTESSHRDQLLRLSAYANLAHQKETNEFGVRLARTAHHDPSVALVRWWSERTATARFLRIRPDAHGLWTADGRTVGWFLECDMGTESLPKLIAKLDAYQDLTNTIGVEYPVLFWLPSHVRESNLQNLLRARPPAIPVATATHDADPAGPVWLPTGRWERLPLSGLPSSHGHNTPGNPNWPAGESDLTHQGAAGHHRT